MIIFELYRQLDVRMFQTISVMDDMYGSCAKYIMDGDNLVILGMDHSIKLTMLDKGVERDNPVRNWDIEDEAVMWFAEDSVEAGVIRMINNAYRQWLQIDPFPNDEAFLKTLDEINSYLQFYDLHIFLDNSGMSVFLGGEPITFEEALDIIMETDENRMDENGINQLINEAEYYKRSDRFEDAAVRLEKVVRYAEHDSAFYTETIFELAQVYYFMGNYDRAAELFYRVNLDYVEEPDYFYLHLGHALVDAKMPKYDRYIRIYFHSMIDPEFADTHRQAVIAASSEMKDVWDEYEQTCYEMGVKKYAEYQASLPEDADDIDRIMQSTYETPADVLANPGHKPYMDIHLMEPASIMARSEKSPRELLADALDFFLKGDYQEAFNIYCRLKEEVTEDTDFYTWVFFQLGKLYTIFDEPKKAWDSLQQCDPLKFGMVYRQEDFFVLYQHVHIVNNDFESDARFRKLIRGRFDVYFAQYDHEYNGLLRDKKLMNAFKKYEAECEAEGREEFGDLAKKARVRNADLLAGSEDILENVNSGRRFFRRK